MSVVDADVAALHRVCMIVCVFSCFRVHCMLRFHRFSPDTQQHLRAVTQGTRTNMREGEWKGGGRLANG